MVVASAEVAAPAAGEPDWWRAPVQEGLRAETQQRPVTVESLLSDALLHSARIREISELPLIAKAQVDEAGSLFDPRAFMESRLDANNEPVGNTLTTGGPPRLLEQKWYYSAGVRQRLATGGTFELSQRIGLDDSNSLFFDPLHQGNARLFLGFNQPLLRQSGRVYNTSRIVLAEIDQQIAWDRFVRDLQAHLVAVAEGYWELYYQRSLLIQKQQHVRRAQSILSHLERRREIDALVSQVCQARAALASRSSELTRAAAAIQNTEARIRSLVNVREPGPGTELVTVETPVASHPPLDLPDALRTAFHCRPEMNEARNECKAAHVRLGVSEKDLLPVLDFVTEAHVNGLNGQNDVWQSLVDQFGRGGPSVGVGLIFEMPFGNRAARAQHQRRQIELRQLVQRLNVTAETLSADVEAAVRDVDTAYAEIGSKTEWLRAAVSETQYFHRRWELAAGEEQSASILLRDLLDAQERLAQAEQDLARSQVAHTLAHYRLKQATGTLLQAERVVWGQACEAGIPRITVGQTPAPASGTETLPLPPPVSTEQAAPPRGRPILR